MKLIYSHCLIRFNLSSENNDFGFISNQKITFSKKKSHLNAIESKFDLDIKLVKVNLGSSFEQTWKAPHPQCYIPSTNITGFLVPEKKNFKESLPYMGVAAILAM